MYNIILIDTSYIFHRVTATHTWSKKSGKEFNNDTIYNNFISSITKLSKNKKKNSKDIKKLQSTKTLEMHIKLELASLGLGRGSTNPKHIIPGVSQVKPTKVTSEFNNFFKILFFPEKILH